MIIETKEYKTMPFYTLEDLHLRAFKMRVVTLPLPLETPTLVGVLNRQRCKTALARFCLQGQRIA
jgi:hypothetical protein